ncbi:hypothetical protein J4Q44_G00003910 [Coregonus suidteri]|uniref:Uncharacterized protein n=1 Tax=Coregonus suidteri TaxID=861788 RepID=A0AAN8R8U2_9TELE
MLENLQLALVTNIKSMLENCPALSSIVWNLGSPGCDQFKRSRSRPSTCSSPSFPVPDSRYPVPTPDPAPTHGFQSRPPHQHSSQFPSTNSSTNPGYSSGHTTATPSNRYQPSPHPFPNKRTQTDRQPLHQTNHPSNNSKTQTGKICSPTNTFKQTNSRRTLNKNSDLKFFLFCNLMLFPCIF